MLHGKQASSDIHEEADRHYQSFLSFSALHVRVWGRLHSDRS